MKRAITVLLLCAAFNVSALDNGLARTPPMGWNPWSEFSTGITEAIFREIADSVVSKGLQKAGYIYMNMDGAGRYSDRKALGTWLHGKGFKFGAYGNTVNWNRAENVWVTEWVSYAADFVKWDAYNRQASDATFPTMRDELAKASRPILYSANNGGGAWPANMPDMVNMMRTTPDIYIPWEDPRSAWDKIVNYIHINDAKAALAKPGFWNDPDFLLVGLTDGWTATVQGFTYDENKTHFSLWCIAAAPLLIGTDVRDLKPSSLEVLLNSEVIALDQDSLGYQGRVVKKNPDQTEIWTKNLKNGDKAVLLVNFSTAARTMTVRWKDIGMASQVTTRDLWAHKDLGPLVDSLTPQNIPGHGCALFRLSGQSVPVAPVPAYELRVAPVERSRLTMMTPHADWSNRPGIMQPRVFDPRGRNAADCLTHHHGERSMRIFPLITIEEGARP